MYMYLYISTYVYAPLSIDMEKDKDTHIIVGTGIDIDCICLGAVDSSRTLELLSQGMGLLAFAGVCRLAVGSMGLGCTRPKIMAHTPVTHGTKGHDFGDFGGPARGSKMTQGERWDV